MRALISTSDKSGLGAFARGLAELGWELVASGGTAAHLEELGLEVTRVESLTDVPELLGGLIVSTLFAIEGREPRAAGPVVRPAFHGTYVSLFCRVEVAQVFFGKCTPQ